MTPLLFLHFTKKNTGTIGEVLTLIDLKQIYTTCLLISSLVLTNIMILIVLTHGFC